MDKLTSILDSFIDEYEIELKPYKEIREQARLAILAYFAESNLTRKAIMEEEK